MIKVICSYCNKETERSYIRAKVECFECQRVRKTRQFREYRLLHPKIKHEKEKTS